MKGVWQRDVPVYDVPIVTRPFIALCGLAAVGMLLVAYREVVGLGAASGMNDAYAWGIWKTFNTMVLTGLGSSAFALGIAVWIFKKDQLHTVMRTAMLTSFLAYAFGLAMLGVDVGRPWNFYWITMPWHWNLHSPLLEVAVCMSIYASIPLFLENVPPALEYFWDGFPDYRPLIEKIQKIFVAAFPFVASLAYVLPAMHQSSLGALMLLAGKRLSPLWQTPFLPLLYVWAAAFLGVAFVTVVLLACGLVWNRPLDVDVLAELTRISYWLIVVWLGFRLVDLTVRGQIVAAFAFDFDALLFWVEMIVLGLAGWKLRESLQKMSPRLMMYGALLALVGGMMYRFDPTTTAFTPRAEAVYFPSVIELLISFGFMAIGAVLFLFLVKVLPILPGPISMWNKMEAERAKNLQKRSLAGPGTQFATGD
ncbi:MAG TPA: Ni/Fe-hydrogenase cytochrome b subunit [Terriglobales bacterium]